MQNRRSALTLVCLSAVLAIGCEKPGSPPTAAPASDAPAAAGVGPAGESESESMLEPIQGEWVGKYTLTWMDPEKSAFSEEVSDGAATVTGDRIEYTWEFRGKPQSGAVESTLR